MKLSVVIPSYKDPTLLKTIDSLFSVSSLGDDLEIVVVFDGYKPKYELPDRKNLRYVWLPKNVGMRGAINAGIKEAKGDYVAKCDEHCNFGQGFDLIMVESCPQRGVITSLRYALNPDTWENYEGPPTGYEKMIIHEGRFVGVRWRTRDKKYPRAWLDENMAMQGSFYLMTRSWWDKIGILQEEGYGSFAQEMAEVLFKTWWHGGVLLLNKLTWYSHKHRSFKRTHGGTNRGEGNAYAMATWKDYYEKEILPRWT